MAPGASITHDEHMDEQTATMDDECDDGADAFAPPTDAPTDGIVGPRPPRWYELPVARDPGDRKLGGVIGGVSRSYGFDVRTTRIAVAVATIVIPVLALVYIAAWVVLPPHPDDAASFETIVRDRRRLPLYLAISIVLVAGGLGSLGSWFLFGGVPWGLGLILLGVLLWVTPALAGRQDRAAWTTAAPSGGAGDVATEPMARATVSPPPRSPRRSRYPAGAFSVVAAFTFAAVAAGGDALGWWNVPLLTGFIWVLGILASGAAISTLVNRWWLPIPVLLVLAATASVFLVAQPNLDGGTGTQRFEPASADELAGRVHLAVGELTVDLSRLGSGIAGTAPIVVDLEVGLGRLHLLVPDDATVQLTSRLGAGELHIDGVTVAEGMRHDDTRTLAPRRTDDASPGATFVIDVTVGIGQIDVDRVVPR